MDQWLIGLTYLMFSLLDPALPLSLFYVHMTMIMPDNTSNTNRRHLGISSPPRALREKLQSAGSEAKRLLTRSQNINRKTN